MSTGLLKNYIRTYRHRKLLQAVEIPKTGAVLDVSCSDGQLIGRLHATSPGLRYFGIDISAQDIERAQTDFPFAIFGIADAAALPFEENTFDIIFSILSLHHYEKSNEFFREISRILKQDGILYLADLIPKNALSQNIYNWNGCPEPYHFEKFYSIEDLKVILQPAGLEVIQDDRVTFFPRIRVLRIQKQR